MELLNPCRLNSFITVRNRVFMAPLTRSRASSGGLVNELHQIYYQQRAGAGLIISEGTTINARAGGYLRVPGIFTKEQIEAWKGVTAAVERAGGLIFCQLWHVGRISHPDFMGGLLPLAPSPINHKGRVLTYEGIKESVCPQEMSKEDIKNTIADFRQAAVSAIEAGFAGVEIHSSNGYLFHQFFARSANQRSDEYGGSIENRCRFLFQVVEAIAEVIPLERVGLRLNPMMHDSGGIMVDEESLATFDYIVGRLNDYPLAFLHLTRPSKTLNYPYFEPDIIGRYRSIYKGFLLANGGYEQDSAEVELQHNRADAIAFGRLFISNPELVKLFQEKKIPKAWDNSTFYSEGARGYIDYE